MRCLKGLNEAHKGWPLLAERGAEKGCVWAVFGS